MKKHKQLTRRHFLQRCSALALGSSTSLAALSQLQLSQAFAQSAEDDYKALVCVFLFGGNDAFNMVVPRSDTAYNAYADARRELAVAQEMLLPISSTQGNGVDYGLHPGLSDLAGLYGQNKLAVLGNVGALIEPTSKTAYQNKSVALPPQLFSHNDQQNFAQSLQSSTKRNGWVGRAADVMQALNENARLSMNISLSGSNLWQAGAETVPYSVNPAGINTIRYMDRNSEDNWELARIATLENLLGQQQQHIFVRNYAQAVSKAWDLADEVGAAVSAAPAITTTFPAGENRLGAGLNMVAQLIAARSSLKVSRQTFFVGMGDFDTHGDQNRRQDLLMTQLNDALAAFYAATVELGVADKVTTFTTSDFGRTLSSNGDGTDHGWGGHQFIMGNAIQGGNIYGTMPELALGSNDDMGEGRIIPSTSIDQYAATLAGWFGVPSNIYADVFPNLGNFDTTNLGFMKTT